MNPSVDHAIRVVLFTGLILSFILLRWRPISLRRGWLGWLLDMSPHFFYLTHMAFAAFEGYFEENVFLYILGLFGCVAGARFIAKKSAELEEAGSTGEPS